MKNEALAPGIHLHRATIEPRVLLALLLSVIAAAVPLFPKVAIWVTTLFVGSCGLRLLLRRPSRPWVAWCGKILFFATVWTGIKLTYGSVIGVEPGLSIVLLLIALKVLEAHSVRDFQIVAVMGFFLALCVLFFFQAFSSWLYVISIFFLLTTVLVRCHRGPKRGAIWVSMQMAGQLLLQAIPLVIVLFLFFPRGAGGLTFRLGNTFRASTGMSEQLTPGSFSNLARSEEIAFRAQFAPSAQPPQTEMYWRGAVLAGVRADGLAWVLGETDRAELHSFQLAGLGISQRITLQPHGGFWIFALDRPTSEPAGAVLQEGDFLRSRKPVNSPLSYTVISRPESRDLTLTARERQRYLAKPAQVSPRVLALVQSWWKARSGDASGIVREALRFFGREKFSYTLQPGSYSEKNGLEEFLFTGRKGFCEHYAAAFATLMRIANIPSRVVVGYHGGEYNDFGKYVIVRQSDAHAWCEVWLEGSGWRRIDPTQVIAPERLASGLADFLQSHDSSSRGAASAGSSATPWGFLARQARLTWDNLSYQWDLRVLNFDEDSQRNLLFLLGLGALGFWKILGGIVVALALLLGVIFSWLRRPERRRRVEPIRAAYEIFQEKLARAGFKLEPWEGPMDFAQRSAEAFPASAGEIDQISRAYIDLRYGSDRGPARPLIRRIRRFKPRREPRRREIAPP